jgi:hypothetical protein
MFLKGLGTLGSSFEDTGDRMRRSLRALRKKIQIQAAIYAKSCGLLDGNDSSAQVKVM